MATVCPTRQESEKENDEETEIQQREQQGNLEYTSSSCLTCLPPSTAASSAIISSTPSLLLIVRKPPTSDSQSPRQWLPRPRVAGRSSRVISLDCDASRPHLISLHVGIARVSPTRATPFTTPAYRVSRYLLCCNQCCFAVACSPPKSNKSDGTT